jgi:hypothetical protein
MAVFFTLLPGAWATDDCKVILGGGSGGGGTTGDVQAGEAIPAQFAGVPPTASVTLPTPYADSKYSVATQVTSVTNRVIPTNVVNITATGFDIVLSSRSLIGLAGVRWQTTPFN